MFGSTCMCEQLFSKMFKITNKLTVKADQN